MQLDKTQLVIRERQFWEIVDLALPYTRLNFGPLMRAMALGILPCMLVNHLLIGWMAASEILEYEAAEFPFRYVLDMALLVFLEAPLAASCATLFLGRAAFLERPTVRTMLAEVRRASWRLMVCHGLLRGVFLAWFALAVSDTSDWPNGGEVALILIAIVAMGIRSLRPYMNEIILLEQSPFVAKSAQQQSIARRSERLHRGGDTFGRWLGTMWIAVLLTCAVASTALFVAGFLLGNWRWTPFQVNVAIPLSMWLVATYITVVRYLNYLDTRIRQEGWEVELRMRAESQRLAARIVAGVAAVVVAGYLAFMSQPSSAIATEELRELPPHDSRATTLATIDSLPALPIGLLAAPGVDDAAQESLKRQRFPWYDPTTDSLRRVTVRDRQARDENRKSRWDDDGRAKSANRLSMPNGPNTTTWIDVLRGLMTVVVYGVIGLIVVGMVVLLIRYYLRREQPARDSQDGRSEEDEAASHVRLEKLPFQVTPPMSDLLTAARQAYQLGDFGQAVVYYFSYQLVELDRQQWIQLTRGKTNRQYLREVRGQPDLAEMLGKTMELFESVFFGHHRLEREAFESCWNDLSRFQQRVERSTA